MKSTTQLDQHGITYQLRQHNGQSHTAAQAAAVLGLPVNAIVKTLVLTGRQSGPVIALVPGDNRLDVDALRQQLHDRSIHFATPAEVLNLTGYPVGLVSPFGLARQLPVYADNSITQLSQCAVSAGVVGAEIIVSASDLIQATNASIIANRTT